MEMTVRARIAGFTALYLLCLALALAGQVAFGGYSSDLYWKDEASHYINGLLIHDYVAEGFPGNPIDYAIQYYLHYPKVAIGHWPPLYYVIEAAAFFIGGPRPVTALICEALFAAGIAALVGYEITRMGGWIAGLSASLAALAAPEIFFGIENVMLDVPITFFALLAMLVWARFLAEPKAWSAVGFAAAAIATIMTKGNGFFLALLPLFSTVAGGRLRLLRDWRFWLPAPIVGVITIPWYLATYNISADGFQFAWGIAYVKMALPVYTSSLITLIGIPGLLVAALGGLRALLRRDQGRESALGVTTASFVVAGLAYHCIVPVAIEARYLVPLVPALIILVYFALGGLLQSKARQLVLTASIFLLVLASEFTIHTKSSRRLADAADIALGSAERNSFILVGSNPGGEGAVIADVATTDRARTTYVIRGFKALASGNFMGTDYHPRFADANEMQRWIETSGIGWVVIETGQESLSWRHNAELLRLAISKPPGWTLVADLPNQVGEVRLYRVASGFGRRVDPAELLREIAPTKVIGR